MPTYFQLLKAYTQKVTREKNHFYFRIQFDRYAPSSKFSGSTIKITGRICMSLTILLRRMAGY